ncbi:hypothetical protein CAEBREN_04651 [Caenorhabditis brenneri]|uniref:Uncharacterized protein n=1 Tax=Caenorhabditis brenneri TaxID=135651 RepID=G0NH60_CAEBE|nr:hypothetical protein CAEBREN_04651 [Caenorhabditis brenneri]
MLIAIQYLTINFPNVLCLPFPQPICFINGFFVVNASFSYASLDCPCPQIKSISQNEILNLPYSEYLGNLPISKPSVTIGTDCVITVDPSGFTDFHSFFFMIFRTGAPPIFNKRFYAGIPRDPFVPVGLTCSEDGEWNYFGGNIENMSFAFMSNEGKCDCGEFPRSIPTESCDIFELKCPEPTNALYLSDQEVGWNLVYYQDDLPNITCQKSPLAPVGENGGSFWIVDGIMLSEAAFACLTQLEI